MDWMRLILTGAPRSAISTDHTLAQVFGFSTDPSRHDRRQRGLRDWRPDGVVFPLERGLQAGLEAMT